MDGETLYHAHQDAVSALFPGMVLPPWERLTFAERCDWETRAYEQTLRDRPDPAKLREAEGE